MLVIFIISLSAISAVSAADNATGDSVSIEKDNNILNIVATETITSVDKTDVVNVENASINKGQSDELIENVKHDNEVGTTDENELISSSATFTDLANDIANASGELNLTKNYTYSSIDSSYNIGITINKLITINGNGFTLDGSNNARIFSVATNNVIFKDIIFVNAKISGNGAAIEGKVNKFTIINCTFINNVANSGGAIYKGSVINSTFINNSANYGGAVNSGYATNCTFVMNHASSAGGAIYGGSANKCNFTKNYVTYASGGASSGSSCLNCIFINNSAWQGGAMNGGSATNCTFINNNVNVGGGAMYDGSAVNCTFINNSASEYGGAMYDGSAANCTFISNIAEYGGAIFASRSRIYVYDCIFRNNNATENGGAMWGGIVNGSKFIKNHADKNGGAIYNVLISNSLFEYNSAMNGGGMSKNKAKNCIFNYNSASDYGGAAYDAFISDNSQFNLNIASCGNDTFNVTWFEVNGKSFLELNELINNNTKQEIYLDSNYTFDLISDSSFEYEGIHINRTITIYGNGFIIDGTHLASFFRIINAENVILRDIIFINAGATGGRSAIDGNCKIINCTFKNTLGRAIFGASAINCIFIDNSIAIGEGSAFDCIFIENNRGGNSAMYDSTAVNCTFINNSANNGGAMRAGHAVNCTFINNSANYGGAINQGYAVNCTFINNSAHINGGATYGTIVNGCIFRDNNAEDYGGAMYSGSAENCVFKNNTAGIEGNNTYETILPQAILTVSNYSSYYNSNDELLIDLTTKKGVPITDVNITIRVYKNTMFIGTYFCLSEYDWVVKLDAGDYVAVLTVENYAYDVAPVSVTLKINKTTSIISSSPITTIYNMDDYTVITLNDGQGYPINDVVIYVDLDGVKNYTTDANGTIKVPTMGLAANTYVATITFAGNGNYIGANATVNVIITQAAVNLITNYTVNVWDDGFTVNIIVFTNPSINDNLTIKFNGKEYPVEVVNGTANVMSNKVYSKTYRTDIIYEGSQNYKNSASRITVIVKATKVSRLNTFTYYYYNNDMGSDSEKGISQIKVVDVDGNPIKNGVVTITIMNKYKLKVKTDGNGVAKFTKAYKPGTYSVTAEHNNKVTKLGNLVLKSVVNLPKVSKVSKSAKTTTIKITLKGTGPIKGKTVVVSFMKVNYKVQTDKGVALFKVTKDMVSKLAVGKSYTVRATYRMDSVAQNIQILK